MFVSGLTNEFPILKGSYNSFSCLPKESQDRYGGDAGTGSSYAVCASCAVVCCTTLDRFKGSNHGLQILEVDEFPPTLEDSSVAEYECVQFGDTKLVFKFKVQ